MQDIDFLIIGAQKSGTTSLMRFLERNPKHFFVAKQECHFWSRDYKYYDPDGFTQYMSNFLECRPDQIAGEKSPSYLANDKVAERVGLRFPKMKIIAILRNPADRAYSAFLHGRRIGAISKSVSFGEAIHNYKEFQGVPYGDVISQGFYAKSLISYYEQFGSDQILIIDFAEMVADPKRILRQVLEFLLPFGTLHDTEFELVLPKINVARKSMFPQLVRWVRSRNYLSIPQKNWISDKTFTKIPNSTMSLADREYLDLLFEESRFDLEQLTGKSFQWSSTFEL